MSLNNLSTEILQKIYEYATVKDVLNLSQTSKKNYNAYLGRQLPILRKSIYNSPYSPFPELVKLVHASSPPITRNKSLGTEIRRRTTVDAVINSSNKTPQPLSLPFIQKMVTFALIAERWVEIYPQLRWRYDSSSRRLLRPHEAFRLRKAIYQLWTYHLLFHDEAFCALAPDFPSHTFNPHNTTHESDLRLTLARTWTTTDVIRQSEFVSKMRQLIDIDLFPSNAVIQYQYSHNHNDVRPVPQKTLSKLAWGETFAQRALSNACLKSNPQEMLELYVGTDTKAQRLAFLMAKGRWFTSVPASWDAVVAVSMREGDEDGVPVPNWVGVSLPSAEVPWRAPHVDLVDREVECGIIDVEGKRSEPGMAYSGYGNMSGEEWHGLRAGSTSVEGESEESEDNEEA